MKAYRIFLFLTLLNLGYWTVAAQGNVASGGDKRSQIENRKVKFTSYKLKNGLRVLLAPDESDASVAVNISFNAGSGKENFGQAGLAGLVQNFVLQNLRREARSGQKTFEGVVNQERAGYFYEFSSSQLDLMLSSLTRQMRPPDISQAFIDEQRAVVQNQCRQSGERRFGRVQETLLELIYNESAFRNGAICSPPDLLKLSPEKAKSFFTTYYVPNNAVLVVVGNFNLNETKKTIAKHLGSIPRQAAPPATVYDDQRFASERHKIITDSRANAATYMSAYLIVPSNHPDWYALNILADIIGQGNESRLYTALVATKLASSIPEGVSESRGQGLFRIGAALMPEATVVTVEGIIDAELARIQKDGVTPAEIDKARAQERQYSAEQLDTPLGKASFLARSALYYDDPNRVNTELNRILAATAKDVQRVARKYLVKTNRAVVIAQPAP